jgi:cathepsin B
LLGKNSNLIFPSMLSFDLAQAFASIESMSDRICIHSSGSAQFMFSPEDLLSCCTSCGDCGGGYMMSALDFYINEGIVSGGDVNSNEVSRRIVQIVKTY